jgi:hypothetical protein
VNIEKRIEIPEDIGQISMDFLASKYQPCQADQRSIDPQNNSNMPVQRNPFAPPWSPPAGKYVFGQERTIDSALQSPKLTDKTLISGFPRNEATKNPLKNDQTPPKDTKCASSYDSWNEHEDDTTVASKNRHRDKDEASSVCDGNIPTFQCKAQCIHLTSNR